MKHSEKPRLTALVREAVAHVAGGDSRIESYADKAASRFSPTNAQSYRMLAEIVWWHIAADSRDAAMRLLDALCEVDDQYYWMFHALASAFATRAWLHTQHKETAAAREDARVALQWVHRDPNAKAITEPEVRRALKRFDDWLAGAVRAKGTVRALRGASHAMRVLVMYQQFAKAGDPAAKKIPAREFTTRLDAGLRELRRRIESL